MRQSLLGFFGTLALCFGLTNSSVALDNNDNWADGPNSYLASSLIGTWVKLKAGNEKTDKAMTFFPNGTFQVDLDRDGKRDVWGEYSVDQDVITLIDTGGDFVKPATFGKYRFSVADNELGFTLLEDKVQPRVKAFSQVWEKKK